MVQIREIIDARWLRTLSLAVASAIAAVQSLSAGVHVVDRGETWESIAATYGIDEPALKRLNTDVPLIYVGMTINVPDGMTAEEAAIARFYANHPMKLDAVDAYERKDYKKSAKLFSELIKNHPDAPLEIYYKRGLAYYNWGKMNQTMADMQYVSSRDAKKEFPKAASIYRDAQRIEEQRAAERAAIVGAVVGVAATATATYFTAKAASEQQSASSASSSGSGGSSRSSSSTSSTRSSSSYSSDSDSGTAAASASKKKASKCGACGGRGYNVEYTAGYGLAKPEYCAECGKDMMSNHWHKTCQRCGGSGVE